MEATKEQLSQKEWEESFHSEVEGVKETNRDRLFRRFEKQARFLGNGVYTFAGIHHTDTGELFEQALKNEYENFLYYQKHKK